MQPEGIPGNRSARIDPCLELGNRVCRGFLLLVLTFRLGEQVHQFTELDALLLGIAGRYGLRNAVRGMGLENLILGLGKRGLHRLDLVQDVNAVAILFHHLANAAHLTLDPAEAVYQ